MGIFAQSVFTVRKSYSQLILQHLLSSLTDAMLRLDWKAAKIEHQKWHSHQVCDFLEALSSASMIFPIPVVAVGCAVIESASKLVRRFVLPREQLHVISARGEDVLADRVIVAGPPHALQV